MLKSEVGDAAHVPSIPTPLITSWPAGVKMNSMVIAIVEDQNILITPCRMKHKGSTKSLVTVGMIAKSATLW